MRKRIVVVALAALVVVVVAVAIVVSCSFCCVFERCVFAIVYLFLPFLPPRNQSTLWRHFPNFPFASKWTIDGT